MMNLGHLGRETDWILSSPTLSGFDFKDHEDIDGLTPATEEEIVSSVSFDNVPISVPLPSQKERPRNPPPPRAPFWNFLEDHRYAKSPRAFPKPTPPRPLPAAIDMGVPSSSFASRPSSNGKSLPVKDKSKKPLSDTFKYTSLTAASFSGSVLPSSPKKMFLPDGMSLDPSKLVFKDIDALDTPDERREKRSITGRSKKYNFGNPRDTDNDLSSSFFGKKKGKKTTSLLSHPRQLSLTGDILLNDIIGDPESRRKRIPQKDVKSTQKKTKASASRLSSSSDDNDMFVWDTVKLKSKGKEAREKSKAETSARKEKNARKSLKEKKPTLKSAKKAVVKKPSPKSDPKKKAKTTPSSAGKLKDVKKRKSILASVTALASSKKKNKTKKPIVPTPIPATPETHRPASSSIVEMEEDGVAGPSGVQKSTVWLDGDVRDEKYFNKNFAAVSLENVIVSPRRRNSSQSTFTAPEPEPTPAATRPVPPKKPKRKI